MESKYQQLLCPDCLKEFFFCQEVNEIPFYSCKCRTYPEIEGVLLLDNNQDYLSLVKKLGREKFFWEVLGINHEWISSIPSYEEAVNEIVKEKSAKDYVMGRYFTDSFLASLKVLLPMVHESESILDFGAGTGHLSFLIHQLLPGVKIFNLDNNLLWQILGKRFVSTQAQYICIKNQELEYFSEIPKPLVICIDVLHYFSSTGKHQELLKKLSCIGKTYPTKMALLHVHHKKPTVQSRYLPISLKEIQEALPGIKIGSNTEETILEKLFKIQVQESHATHYFTKEETPLDEIDVDVFKRIFHTPGLKWVLNPLYQLKKIKKIWELQLQFQDEISFQKHFPFAYRILPEKIQLSEAEINLKMAFHLFKQGVIQVLPEQFVKRTALRSEFSEMITRISDIQ